MAVDILAWYTFNKSFNIPLTLKAGSGHSVTHNYLIGHNSLRPQYNTNKIDLLDIDDVKINSSIGYLNFKF